MSTTNSRLEMSAGSRLSGQWLSTCILAVLLGAGLRVEGVPPARVANTTLRMPPAMPVVGYGLTNALGDLTFNQPIGIVFAPGETNRLYVLEKGGRILVVTNLNQPTMAEFLDERNDVRSSGEAGLLSLAFHPGYATNGFLFVYHLVHATTDGTHYGLHDELVRYSVDPDNHNRVRPESKLRLFAQYDDDDGHNGGELQFGPDGYLYLAIGDTGPSRSEGPREPQSIDRHFFGGLIRIDVDRRAGNLPPNPYQGGTTNYAIPSDNPFIGCTNFNGRAVEPSQVRTEFFAVGLRSPWRLSFDGADLYCSDTGNAAYEEVNLIRPGANYGWPYFEGFMEGPFPELQRPAAGFVPVPPLYAYGRGNRLDQGKCVIGGRVYRGQNIPRLNGAYVFGDHVIGRIWALRHHGTNVTQFETLASLPGLTAFAADPANGDLLAASLNGQIQRLIYVAPEEAAFPLTLADTGAFADLQALTPAHGIMPYEVSLPFWSDNAIKKRWFSLPDLEQKIAFSPTENWTFPPGAVWIKHFELELTNGVAASRRRIETRLLVKTADGVYGVTYRWGDSVTNAQLVDQGGMEETFTIHDHDTIRNQTWIYPGRTDCLRCHNPGAGYVLGFNSPQLNCNVLASGVTTNQIQLLAALDYLDRPEIESAGLPLLASPTDTAMPIEHRFRSYLHANCSACHYPGGPPNTIWNARITSPMSLANIINGSVLSRIGGATLIQPGQVDNSALHWRLIQQEFRMPPVAATLLDSNAINLVAEFIRSIPLPPWASEDVGPARGEGSSSIVEGLYRVSSQGTNIGGTRDSFHYLFHSLTGNGQFIGRLQTSDSPATESGLMMRGSLAEDAPYAMISLGTGNRAQFRRRLVTGGGTATNSYPVSLEAKWWRLVREDSALVAYTSTTGSNWTLLGQEAAKLEGDYLVGLARTSADIPNSTTAVFDQVSSLTVSVGISPDVASILNTEPVTVSATVSALNTTLHLVEFYDGSIKIGEARETPYTTIWTNALAGDHVLRAKVTDANGASVLSQPIQIGRLLPKTRLAREGMDATTQGTWKRGYGRDGAILAGITTNLPSQVRIQFHGAKLKTWARSSTAVRSLQRSTGRNRTAAAWLSATNFTVDVECADGGLHQMSLYFLDRELTQNRKQLVEIFDTASGALLASRTVQNFHRGVYLSYCIRGSIQIRVTRLSGLNAVLSGIFLDPAQTDLPDVHITSPLTTQRWAVADNVSLEAAATDLDGIERVVFLANGIRIGEATNAPFKMTWPVPGPEVFSLTALAIDILGEQKKSEPVVITGVLPTAKADLIRKDGTTHGNWLGAYGSEGFVIAGYVTNYPPYAAFNLGNPVDYVWFSQNLERELQKVTGDGRVLSAWAAAGTMDLKFVDGREHNLAIYFMDNERGRSERVEMLDGDTGEILSGIELPSFGDGQYGVWRVRGHLTLRLMSTLGPFPVLSGFFFDPADNLETIGPLLSPKIRWLDGRLTFSIIRRKDSPGSYGVETSTDLVHWSAAGDEIRELEVQSISEEEERVVYQFSEVSPPSEKRFVRLRLGG